MLYEKIKEWIAVHWKECVCLICSCILAFIFYGIYAYPHYATDTYKIVNTIKFSPEMIWNDYTVPYIKVGRYTLGLMMYVLSFFGVNPLVNNIFSNSVSILFFGISLFLVVWKINERYSKSKVQIIEIFIYTVPIFLNPLYTDWFQFPECVFYYSLGLMLMTREVLKICFEKMDIKSGIKSFLSLFIIFGIYQMLINIFAILVVVFLLINWNENENKSWRVYIKRVLYTGICYLVCSLSQIAIIKIVASGLRMNSDIKTNLFTVIRMQPVLWSMTTTGAFDLTLILATVIIVGYLIFSVIKNKNIKNYYILAIIGGTIAICVFMFSTHILAEPWLSQRTTVMLYAFPSFFLLIAFVVNKKNIHYNLAKVITIALMLSLIGNYMYRANNIAIGMQKTNLADKIIVQQVMQKINEYESEKGIEIRKISFKNDKYISWSYPDVFCMFDLNVRAWAVDWARANMFRLYSGRYFEEVPMKEEVYSKYFQDKNWDIFQEAQIQIIDDVAYIMVY